jgi:hypothetical protein
MQSIPRNPIVDTGPLFDFLLWQFSGLSKTPNLLSGLRYLTTDLYKESIQWYFTVAKPITTCPEVIAEIHGHAERLLDRSRLGNFWRFAKELLTELGLSEKLVELVGMDGQTLSSIGPTDTALLHVALVSPNSSQPVFTEDGKLAGQCRKNQVSVLTIGEVLSIWQQYGTK